MAEPIQQEYTHLDVHDERGDLRISLINDHDGSTIVAWHDDDAHQAFEDGTLAVTHHLRYWRARENDPKLHASAYAYAAERDLLPDAPDPEISDEMIEQYLRDLIEAEESDERIADQIHSATSYEDAGILTTDRGIVLRMADGSEYQITIVQRRGPRP